MENRAKRKMDESKEIWEQKKKKKKDKIAIGKNKHGRQSFQTKME